MSLCYHTLGLIFEDGGCMSPAECPCEFHGTLHPPGSVVTEDCNAWSVSTAWREEPGGDVQGLLLDCLPGLEEP